MESRKLKNFKMKNAKESGTKNTAKNTPCQYWKMASIGINGINVSGSSGRSGNDPDETSSTTDKEVEDDENKEV